MMSDGVDTIEGLRVFESQQSSVTSQSTATNGVRVGVLAFLFAMLLAGSTVRVAADQSVSGTSSESKNRKYAQYWGPFDRGFIYGPRRSPRQDLDTGPPPDERLARDTKRKVIEQLRAATPPPPTTGPLLLIVSITKQTITLYDANGVVTESQISSGTSDNPTPTGIFSVLEKNWWHRSNIYSAAPMPYMQRINWEGVALHAGELPGYPASHGCIRLTYDAALRLWYTTKIGTRVIVSQDNLVPIEISHQRLFVPRSSEDQALVAKQEMNPVPVDDLAKNFIGSSTLESRNVANSGPAYSPRSLLAPKGPLVEEVGVQNRVLRPGPISILISQRDEKMYVRKGFEPVFDVPIIIKRSGQSLGTHVFTAIAQDKDDKTLRWTVVSMPSTLPALSSRAPATSQLLSAASAALDRLEISKEASDRVSALMSVGASLIITDRGLGRQAFALDSDYMIPTR